jgi:hypothetical protein
VKVAVGKVNAITGKRWRLKLTKTWQDYVVCPDQPSLDGINAGDGYIRQFFAMPLPMGCTVEGQVTGKEEFGGIQLSDPPLILDATNRVQSRQALHSCQRELGGRSHEGLDRR